MSGKLLLRIKLWLAYIKSSGASIGFDDDGRRKVFFFLSADYGNLGDCAISFAQRAFLEKHFPDANVIEFPISVTFQAIKAARKVIAPLDIVAIVGGGNMGDRYDDIEFLRQLVVRSFKSNRIISFPQTFDFSNTAGGVVLRQLARRVYSSHPDLLLMAREKVSFGLMKRYFPGVDVQLVPDIAMTLDKRYNDINRQGALLCLRYDEEQAFDCREEIISQLRSRHIQYVGYDTHIGDGRLGVEERNGELSKIWDAFLHSKFVVTDRLHGMIFAFITGTPALVLPNSNHKIKSSFEWIRDCGYIKLLENPEEIGKGLSYMDDAVFEKSFAPVHDNIMREYNSLLK